MRQYVVTLRLLAKVTIIIIIIIIIIIKEITKTALNHKQQEH